ncbi:copper amine oxidase N-terminal domain-containing protein [Paenibacillus sp. sgz500958]|uniref:copper amine oxidase N-terminal domain-containing protein n=1 Tax=Paenibacillus sp. sgz500958 TaxID=3242475 RepID=UPI0036D36F87
MKFKIFNSLLAALVLSGMISLSAFAAEQPITVLIDQQKLELSGSAPVNDHGSILLPMRAIFKELGLDVKWDSKTGSITGTKNGLIIKLKVGSKQASINGTAKQLTSSPQVIDKVTYVPLRFVSTATGSDIKWDPKNNTVTILTKQNTVDPKEISAFFENYVAYSNKENYDGFMSLIDPQSPLGQIGPQIKDQMAQYDFHTTIDQLDILSLKPGEATVHTIESSHKISGPFMLDSKSDYTYSLVKKENSWLISNLQINGTQYILPDEMLKAAITVPKADEEGIMAVLQANLKYSNEENMDGVLSTIDAASPAFAQSKEAYGQIFKVYDLLFAFESTKIISYSENEAAVYVVQTTKKVKGPDFQDNRTTSVSTLKKTKDGKWVVEQTFLIKSEALTQ